MRQKTISDISDPSKVAQAIEVFNQFNANKLPADYQLTVTLNFPPDQSDSAVVARARELTTALLRLSERSAGKVRVVIEPHFHTALADLISTAPTTSVDGNTAMAALLAAPAGPGLFTGAQEDGFSDDESDNESVYEPFSDDESDGEDELPGRRPRRPLSTRMRPGRTH